MPLSTLLSRAGAGLNLTPAERAFLRFGQAAFYGAALTAFQAVLPLLNNPTPSAIQWAPVAHTFVATLTVAFAMAMGKYHGALADAPITASYAPVDTADTALPAAPAPQPAPAAAPVAAAVSDPAAGA